MTAPDDNTSTFEIADRVRVIATGETGSVVAIGLDQDQLAEIDVLLDGYDLSLDFRPQEIEHYTGPPAGRRPVGALVTPARRGLPGVGDAVTTLADIIGELFPGNADVQAKLDALQASIDAAVPTPRHLDDGFGNGWVRCGDGCDLEVVRPGKVQCSGVVCGTAVDPGPDTRNPDDRQGDGAEGEK